MNRIDPEQLLNADDNYICIELNYNKHLVVKYEAGVEIIKGLQKAEIYTDRYNEPNTIEPVEDELKFSFMPRAEYTKIKMEAALLAANFKGEEPSA